MRLRMILAERESSTMSARLPAGWDGSADMRPVIDLVVWPGDEERSVSLTRLDCQHLPPVGRPRGTIACPAMHTKQLSAIAPQSQGVSSLDTKGGQLRWRTRR